ncbi:solute carrier family 23 member 1 isoform X2 [Procambarus clarkii]|uniref:solute carrier family 23 member 1 isoform X2 n=1 Tax=Procambarus clarkii TaxID=6728 RepID=UPI001E675924|nr:solute carrier family 23 member 1-like [Procambarus clarkii]XP_045604322.1 solute carrier family 23 member 1-like [Procambarus clarkii]
MRTKFSLSLDQEEGEDARPQEEEQEQVDEPEEENAKAPSDDLLYGVEDIPPWYQCLLFGFQHFLIFIGGTIATPLIIISLLCMEATDPRRGDLVSTIIFASGIITLLQATFGIRLPIIQGANFAYLMPTITILSMSFPSCDSLDLKNMTASQKEEEWQIRMREIQGAITVSALFQVFVGYTGLVGMIMRWVTPLTIIPTITMLGLSLFSLGVKQAATHWGVSAMTLLLLVLVSQYLKDVKTPLPTYSPQRGFQIAWFPLFTYFPLLLVMCFSWAVCGVLTAWDLLPQGSLARTDSTGSLLHDSSWFRVPYPGQWGMPTVSVAAVIGVTASVIASIIESIGDYYACANLCKTASPPVHAVNRGVAFEGIGCVLAGLFGTSSGTASYTSNIVLIGVTKVASRRVVQVSAVMMLVAGTFSKIGAVFATIPEPVLGSTLVFMFSLITGVGLSTLRIIDLNSNRNLLVLGFSIFMGLALPEWVAKNPEGINTGWSVLDKSLTSLLQTSMFVGGLLGFILDNSMPGTEEERGLLQWNYHLDAQRPLQPSSDPAARCYDLPYGMKHLARWDWTRRVPFLPMFEGFRPRQSSHPSVMVETLSARPLPSSR